MASFGLALLIWLAVAVLIGIPIGIAISRLDADGEPRDGG